MQQDLWERLRQEASLDAVSLVFTQGQGSGRSCVHSVCLRRSTLTVHLLLQEKEPSLASFLHTTILAHKSLSHSLAFMLANKLSSRTLLGTQLMHMIQDAYARDAVSFRGWQLLAASCPCVMGGLLACC